MYFFYYSIYEYIQVYIILYFISQSISSQVRAFDKNQQMLVNIAINQFSPFIVFRNIKYDTAERRAWKLIKPLILDIHILSVLRQNTYRTHRTVSEWKKFHAIENDRFLRIHDSKLYITQQQFITTRIAKHQ